MESILPRSIEFNAEQSLKHCAGISLSVPKDTEARLAQPSKVDLPNDMDEVGSDIDSSDLQL